MSLIKAVKRAAVYAGLILAGTVSANAAIISNSQIHPYEAFLGFLTSSQVAPGPVMGDSQNHTGIYTLRQFDGSLGTLNSVRIEFDQQVDSLLDPPFGTLPVGAIGSCVSGVASCTAHLNRIVEQRGSVTLGTASASTSLSIDNHTVNCDPQNPLSSTGCAPEFHRNSPFSDATEFTSASDVANFVGSGTFSALANFSASYFATLGADGAVVISEASSGWQGQATVIYDYTPGGVVAMSAPAGAAFLLIGLAALSRRKRA